MDPAGTSHTVIKTSFLSQTTVRNFECYLSEIHFNIILLLSPTFPSFHYSDSPTESVYAARWSASITFPAQHLLLFLQTTLHFYIHFNVQALQRTSKQIPYTECYAAFAQLKTLTSPCV